MIKNTRLLKRAIGVYDIINAGCISVEENIPHVVLSDFMTKDIHVFPKQFLTDIANGTMNLKHLSQREQEEIVRCFASGVLDLSNSGD